jgi:hypothetical protein
LTRKNVAGMIALFRTSRALRRRLVVPVDPHDLVGSRSQILVRNRTFAISRFTERTTGVGRTTRRNPPTSFQQPPPRSVENEQKPFIEESQLWETSRRPPVSSPEDGLKRLLLRNDTLVIERWVDSACVMYCGGSKQHEIPDRSKC